MHMKNRKLKVFQTVLLFLFVIITGLGFLHSPGTFDVNDWQVWAKNADTEGLAAGFKANHENYPPLATVILVSALKAARLFGIGSFDSVKLAIFLFLCLTSFVFWLWTRDLLITAILHLSLLLNSVALGYIDIFFAPSLILSLWALKERKLTLFAVAYTVACLTKWQPLIIAPFIVLYILNISQIGQWKQIEFKRLLLKILLPVAMILVAIFCIFGVDEVALSLFRITSMHPYLSGNALNLNWITTHFLHVFYPDRFGGLINGEASFIVNTSPKLTVIPRLLFFFSYTIALLVLFKREKMFENMLIFSLLGYLAYFVFNTGVHENHLFIAAVLSVVLFWVNRKRVLIMLILILTNNMNLFLFYGIDGTGLKFNRTMGGLVDAALLFAFINVIFFSCLWLATILPGKTTRLAPARSTSG